MLEELIKDLNDEFRTDTHQLTVQRGKIYDYLGINIDYTNSSYVMITMIDFLEDILKEVEGRRDMQGSVPNPAKENLFKVDEYSELLDEDEAEFFHRITAQLLFACKRARPDLQVAVSYLCTRVKAPNRSDYLKLARTIKYVRSTISLPLLLGWDESGTLTWAVDASFAVHANF